MGEELQTIEREVTDVLDRRPSIQAITTATEASAVGEYLTEVIGFRKRIADFFRPSIQKAHELHKSLLEQMKSVDEKPLQAERQARGMMAAWQDAENKRIQKEQARLDEEARKAAAAAAKKDGDKQLAKDIQTGKVAVVAPVAAAPVAKIAGVSTRDNWSAEVVNKLEFIKAVAKGQCSPEWLEVNLPALNKVMQATKGTMVIPGIRAKKTTGVVARGAGAAA